MTLLCGEVCLQAIHYPLPLQNFCIYIFFRSLLVICHLKHLFARGRCHVLNWPRGHWMSHGTSHHSVMTDYGKSGVKCQAFWPCPVIVIFILMSEDRTMGLECNMLLLCCVLATVVAWTLILLHDVQRRLCWLKQLMSTRLCCWMCLNLLIFVQSVR